MKKVLRICSVSLILGGVGFLGRSIFMPDIQSAAAATGKLPPPGEPVGAVARVARFGAALVEGFVDNVTFSYDDRLGPRTNFHMLVEKVHAGTFTSSDITISQYGGFLPNGQFAGASHVPMLTQNRHYLVMLANNTTTAFWSAVVDDYAFAVEDIGAKRVLVSSDGRVMREVSLMGPKYTREAVFEPSIFDGKAYTVPRRIAPAPDGEADELATAVDVDQAAQAIIAAAATEGIRIGGPLASSDPPGSSWQSLPLAPAQTQ